MTVKVVSLDHQKRLDGYWTALKDIADKWEDDLTDLNSTAEISEKENRAEVKVLNIFWQLIELVDELSREEAGINDEDEYDLFRGDY